MMGKRSAWLAVLPGLFAASILLAAPAAAAPGEPAPPEGGLDFSATAAVYPDSAGAPVLHLYVAVPLTSLRFRDDGEGSGLADLRISASLTDDDGLPLGDRSWTYREVPGAVAPADNAGRSVVRRYLFPVPPGPGRVQVKVEEPSAGRVGAVDLRFRAPEFASQALAVSDLTFGLGGEVVVRASAGALEGAMLPHPSRRYGDAAPGIRVQAGVLDHRPDLPDTAYAWRYSVKNGAGKTVEQRSGTAARRGGRGTLLLRPELDDLSLGAYRLEVEVSLDGERAEREGEFEVDESRIAFSRDGRMLRTVLGYVATNRELIDLEDTPEDSLKALWTRFWARRDPTPDTPRNEALARFMDRVEYAGLHYGVLEPGWRSDMGRIYIKYGAPDRVDRVDDGRYGPATEIWYYYARNATFVFQDPDGFGRYRLVGTRRN